MRAASILTVLLFTACAPALRPELRPAGVNDLPVAMSWERTLGDPSWWWPYGFGGWELTDRPRRLDQIEASPATSPIVFGREPGLAEMLQHYRPTRAWRPVQTFGRL